MSAGGGNLERLSIPGSILLVYFGLFVLFSVPNIVANESGNLSLDSTTLKECMWRRSKDPVGLLVFHIVDIESRREIDSVDILLKIAGDRYSNRISAWRAHWRPPGYNSFKLALDGYMSLVIDDIRVPADSAAVVTLRMKRGEGLIQVNAQSDSLLDIGIVSLDGVFPKNEIIGKIIDGSTKNPIFGAAVYCEESAQDVLTDSLGGFVIQLNTLKSVTLNAWHPLYDSIRFVVSKEYIRTTKEIEIYFQSQRMTSEGKTVKLHSDSAVLLLVDVMPWSSWTVQPYEFSNSIYTYEVLQGEVFGPTSDWFYNDCVPFRLIRELPDKTAWIQFSREFKLITAGMNSKTNFLFLSDSTVLLNTRSLDGGTTVSLNLQPDYSPRGLIKKTEYGGRRNRDIPSEKKQVDSCDILKAQVERTHMENILSLLQGDFVSFAKSFSKSYKNPENKQNLPLEEFLKITSEGELPSKFAEKRLLEIFNILYAEEYVHITCSELANERFLKYCEQGQFVPQDGDVYIYWPEASGGWYGGLDVVYRSEEGYWKIVAIF